MLRLGSYEKVLADTANRLGLKSIYDLLLSRDDSEVASALVEHPELVNEVLRARAEIRRISGNERVANAILNYILLRAGGYRVPKTLERELASVLPGIYVVSGERVLVSSPGEQVPDDVSVDAEYMDTLISRLASVNSGAVSIAGIDYGIVDYSYVYKAFFNERLAEVALLKNLVESCTNNGIPILGERVYRDNNNIVAEVDVDVKKMAKERYKVDLPGKMVFVARANRSGRVLLEALYSDDVMLIAHSESVDSISRYADNIATQVLSEVVRKFDIIRQAKEVAESKGFNWVIGTDALYAIKEMNLAGADIVVKVQCDAGRYGSVDVVVEAPATTGVYNVLGSLRDTIGGKITDNDDRITYTISHSFTKETLLSAFGLAESIISKLRSALEAGVVQQEVQDETTLIGALLLKATYPDAFFDVFEKLGTSYLEALKTVISNVRDVDISAMYIEPKKVLDVLSRNADVADDGEPTIFGKPVDEYLAPFNVSRKIAFDVKRAVVDAFTRTRSASLLATLVVRGVKLTPEVLRKLIVYGDLPTPAVLNQEYQGKPLWQYLSNDEKLAVAVKLITNGYWGELSKSDFLTPDDGRILAKALCATRSDECTELAFSELRDELVMPRHAVLRRTPDGTYIDTGAYLVNVKHYDVQTGLYTFSIRYKSADRAVEVKGRTVREVLFKVIDEEEALQAT